jgi:hypothetical protein
MIEGFEHQQKLNSEVEKYKREMQEEQRSFEFVSIGFNVDMREAQVRYREEWRKDIGGIKTSQVSFSQWLDMKKFEATKFYLKHSDYYLGF